MKLLHFMDEHFTFDSCLDADDFKIEIKKILNIDKKRMSKWINNFKKGKKWIKIIVKHKIIKFHNE